MLTYKYLWASWKQHATIRACILTVQYTAIETHTYTKRTHTYTHIHTHTNKHTIHIHIPIDFPAATTGYDSCAYANNDKCDEPNVCLPGTDTTDCTLQQLDMGTCDGVNEMLSSADHNNDTAWDWGTCWAACLMKYNDTLMAINGPGLLF